MPMPGDLVERITEWLNDGVGKNPCSACGEDVWGIGDIVEQPVEHRGPDGRETRAMFALVCANCGQTLFISGTMIGL